MATYTLDEVVGGKTYSLEEVVGKKPQSAGSRFVQGLRDPVDAGAQLLTHILPEGVVQAGNEFNNWLADKTGIVGKLPEGGVDQQIRENEASYVAPEGVDWARIGGNILSPVNLAIASKVPVAATLPGRIGAGALGGAAMGGLQPVGEGDFAEQKAKQIGLGAAVGGVLPMVTGAAARVINPRASANPNVQLLKNEGVTPTLGQTLGGRMGMVEEKLQSVPILGDMISKARGRANQTFERATFNRALKPIGQELPEGLSGREAIAYTEQALSQNYDDVLNRIGAVKLDGSYKMKVASLNSLANKIKDPKAQQAYRMALDTVRSNTDRNGVITSEGFKMVEGDLGKMATKLGSSDDIFLNKAGDAVKQLQAELRDMLKRQAGSNADDLAKTNAAWSQFKRVQRAASALGAEEGSFTPAQFQNAVKALDRSKDKAAFARGGALMQDLGDAGKSVLTGKVGNSFTTDRLLMGGGALGSYMIDPTIPAALVGSSALYSAPVQRALVNAVSTRPELAQPVSELVRRSSPYLLPAYPGLLNQPNN
jgi:hypothetical protein